MNPIVDITCQDCGCTFRGPRQARRCHRCRKSVKNARRNAERDRRRKAGTVLVAGTMVETRPLSRYGYKDGFAFCVRCSIMVRWDGRFCPFCHS